MELEFKQNTNEILYGLVAVTLYVLYVQNSGGGGDEMRNRKEVSNFTA